MINNRGIQLQHHEILKARLLDILQAQDDLLGEEDVEDGEDVRSIMTFPILLQHTLRIYLKNKQKGDVAKISDKELLIIFSENFLSKSISDEDVKDFIELLWKARSLSDKHVIKWLDRRTMKSIRFAEHTRIEIKTKKDNTEYMFLLEGLC